MSVAQRRSDELQVTRTPVDLLGIGFGPANLSLAVAIEDHNADASGADQHVSAHFVEAKPQFGWHDGMLLPGTTMQVSFLKDLASMRSPRSAYTFLNYLHEAGRLTDFINLKTFFPPRHEFHGYLTWAANKVGLPVDYGMRVERIDHESDDPGQPFVVTARDGAGHISEYSAHAIAIGAGQQTALPSGIVASARVFHNHRLLEQLAQIPSQVRRGFLVIGAGQSAAEVVAYLHDTYPEVDVHASIRGYGYVPSDDTPYANRIFDPAAVDDYYTAPPELKSDLLRRHWSTNYAAVDAGLIQDLYQREYAEKLAEARRLHVHQVTELSDITECAGGVQVTLRDLGDRAWTSLDLDAVIFATGFRSPDLRPLFGNGIDYTAAFDGPQPVVARDYSLRLPEQSGRIFLNGGVQHSHGISSSLLSNLAVRAGEILDSATRNRHQATAAENH